MQIEIVNNGDKIQIYTDGILFYEGREFTLRALQTLLLFLGHKTSLKEKNHV